jgi:hypothetical protein
MTSTLFTTAFGDGEGSHTSELLLAYQTARARAATIANSTASTNPSLTDHSIVHLDALWQMADRLIPPGTFNPSEVFVLGIAFLIHDLGNSAALYEKGLLKDAATITALQIQLREIYPLVDEDEIVARSRLIYMRDRHAHVAEGLACQPFADGTRQVYLIENTELRDAFGVYAGRIARSHHDDIVSIEDEFGRLGTVSPPPHLPDSWGVDLLKVACALRACDAIQVDRRRADDLARILAREYMLPDSVPHWDFQRKLSPPRLDGNKVKYTSTSPFLPNEHEAWWKCHDYLQMVDRELAQVDDLLSATGRTPFKANGVKGIRRPDLLSQYIECGGWEPVDLQIRLGETARLATMFGGLRLYGDDPFVPLRELIQNGRDALRLRQLLEKRDPTWGSVTVSLKETKSGVYDLTISDDGLGMTESIVRGYLLAFGESYWASLDYAKAYEEAVCEGFSAIGKHGIGFFSSFMLSDCVKIRTRHHLDSASTLVIEFANGVRARPTVRRHSGKDQEHRRDIGTDVTIQSVARDRMAKLLTFTDNLGLTVGAVCPALDVKIVVRDQDDSMCAIEPIWKELPAEELLARVHGVQSLDSIEEVLLLRRAAARMKPVCNKAGSIVARLGFSLSGLTVANMHGRSSSTWSQAVVCDRGFRTKAELRHCVGVVMGISTGLTRHDAAFMMDDEAFVVWLKGQLEALEEIDLAPDNWNIYTTLCHALGVTRIEFSRAAYAGGVVQSFAQITDLARAKSKLGLVLDQDAVPNSASSIIFVPTLRMAPSFIYEILAHHLNVDQYEMMRSAANEQAAQVFQAILRGWDIEVKSPGNMHDLVLAVLEEVQRTNIPVTDDQREVRQVFILEKDRVASICSAWSARD